MPSETIYSRQGQIDVRVAWGGNQSGEVQVATLASGTDPDPTERLLAIVNEWLRESKMPLIDVPQLLGKPQKAPWFFDGWHASLNDWSEVNSLIKVLKRARDQAFGSPE